MKPTAASPLSRIAKRVLTALANGWELWTSPNPYSAHCVHEADGKHFWVPVRSVTTLQRRGWIVLRGNVGLRACYQITDTGRAVLAAAGPEQESNQ